MKVILTSKEEFKAKSGDTWTKCHFVNPVDGSVGEVFMKSAEFNAFDITADRFASEKALEALKDSCETTDIQFNQRGRVVQMN